MNSPKQPSNASPIPPEALKLNRKVDECKPLVYGACPAGYERLGGQLKACENIDGCAKDPCYALVGRCRLYLSPLN